jgi:hypothetical protein
LGPTPWWRRGPGLGL